MTSEEQGEAEVQGDAQVLDEAGADLDALLNAHFAGKIVRKDLTKMVKEGANVPVFVLEYLLGNYCASQDEEVVNEGLQTVKDVVAFLGTKGISD